MTFGHSGVLVVASRLDPAPSSAWRRGRFSLGNRQDLAAGNQVLQSIVIDGSAGTGSLLFDDLQDYSSLRRNQSADGPGGSVGECREQRPERETCVQVSSTSTAIAPGRPGAVRSGR